MSRSPVPLTSWWRLWTVQGSWNRRSMQGLGWLVVLAPWVRSTPWTEDQRRACLRRYQGFANTNPYLAPLALGVLMRLELEGSDRAAPTAQGLSRSLGALGDRLFWRGIRPLVAWLGAAIGLVSSPVAVLVGWAGFAILQGWVRWRGLLAGFTLGADVVSLLEGPWFQAGPRWVFRMTLVAVGGLGVLVGGEVVGRETWAPALWLLAVGTVAAWRRWDGTHVVIVLAVSVWIASRLATFVGS